MTKNQQDWLSTDGYPSEAFVRIVEEVTRLLVDDHTMIGRNVKSAARMIVSQLAHKQGLTPSNYKSGVGAGGDDWTNVPDVGSNTSIPYLLCVGTVEEVIQAYHLPILTFDADKTAEAARLIVTRLANEHLLTPPLSSPVNE